MSTNGLDITDNDEMAESEEIVTMMDVLQEQQDFEDDANAVLGASDEKNCTYSKGYIKRQAIYACMTCCSEAKIDPEKRAGVCLACSLSCHENHEVIELYTKRNFRCDCGNPKFNNPCQFTSDKTELNIENSYNQNFYGLYCICSRPYPDPDATFEDEMIQCVVCEDWLHASHLEATVPGNDQYSDMICKTCMEKNDFLHDYSDLIVNIEDREVEVANGHITEFSNVHDSEKILNGDVSVNDITKNDDMSVDKEEKENLEVSMNSNDAELEQNENSKEIQNYESEINDKMENDNVHSEEIDNTNKDETKNLEMAMETEQNESKIPETEESVESANADDNIQQLEPNDVSANEISNNDMDTTNVLGKLASSEQPNNEELENMVDQIDTENNEIKKTESSTIAKFANDLQTEENKDLTESEEKPPENDNFNVVSSENNEDKHEPSITEETSDEQNKELEGDTLERATEELSKLTSENTETDKTSNSDVNKDDKETLETDINDDTDQTTSNDNKENPFHLNLQETTINNDNTDQTTRNNSKENPVHLNLWETTQPDNKRKLESIDTFERATEELSKSTSENTEADKTSNSYVNKDDKETLETDINDDIDQTTSNHNKENPVHLNLRETTQPDNKRKLESISENSAKKPRLDGCTRPRSKRVFKGATFWPANFREKLCTCSKCLAMYRDLSVMFLIDPEDTMTAYEALGKERLRGTPTSQYEKGLEALSSLDRVQQINALTEYNKMKDKLLDFLKSFKDRKEIVKEEDIRAFFAHMKPRREPDGVYFCR